MDVDKKALYERLGGEAAVGATVEKFYVKVLADPKLAGFFKNTDMKKQIHHQTTFLTVNSVFLFSSYLYFLGGIWRSK